ncbi:hypothetical protein ACFLQ5_01230 [Bacteroidota bacterium]
MKRVIYTLAIFSFIIPSLLFPFKADAQLSGVKTIGTSGEYPTFNASVTALTTNGVSGPVVFNIASGIYTEQVTIPYISGVLTINSITSK